MILNDVKPTLQQALGLEWVFDLYEILNTRFDDGAWEKHGNNDVGTLKLGDETFELHLEPGTYPVNGTNYRFLNVAFKKILDGHPTEELQWTSKNASAVVGAITNALFERAELYDFDAAVFIANDNVEKSMTIYNKIAQRGWARTGLGTVRENIDLGGGRLATVLLSKALAKEDLAAFYEHLSHLKK
jgi:hypothetical protein